MNTTTSNQTAKVREKIKIVCKHIERYKWSKKLRRKYCSKLLTLLNTFRTCVVKDAENWIKKAEESTELQPRTLPPTVEWQPKVGLKIQEIFGGRRGKIVELLYLNPANIGLSEIKVQYDDGSFDTPYPNQLLALEPSPIELVQPSSEKAKTPQPPVAQMQNIAQPESPVPPSLEAETTEPDLSWVARKHLEVALNGRKAIIINILSQPSPKSAATEVVIRYSDNKQDETCFARQLTRLSPPVFKDETQRKPKPSSADFRNGTEIHKAWIAREGIAEHVNGLQLKTANRVSYRDNYTYSAEFKEMRDAINWTDKIAGYYAKLESFVTKAEQRQEDDEYPPTVIIRRTMTVARGNFFTLMLGETNEDIIFMTSFADELHEVVDRLIKARVGVIAEDGEVKITGSRKKLEAFARKAESKENGEYPPTVIIRKLQTQYNYFAFVIGATSEEIFVTPFAKERDAVIRRLMKTGVGVIIEHEGERYRPKIVADGKIETARIPAAKRA